MHNAHHTHIINISFNIKKNKKHLAIIANFASMETKHIAIDLGATSGRVILATISGGRICMQTLHRFPTPLFEKEGKWMWDIHKLESSIAEGLEKAAGEDIKSIGIDTWGVDFCTVSPDGSLEMPRAYRDPYTNGVPEQFFKQMPRAELYERTGIQIMNFNSVFQMYARKEELSGARKILFMPDALSYFLTGNMVCEYTILSTSALMDPRTKDFDEKILGMCGLRKEQFGPIVMPGHKVGTLKAEFGLGPVPVIAVAGHDTAAAVAAVPATDEGFAYLSSGTWSLMGIETPEPVITEEMAAMNYTNEGGAKGDTRLLKNITGMWLVEQCLAQWRKEGRDYNDFNVITAECKALPKSKATIDVDAPEFASPTNMPRAISEYCRKAGIEAPASDMAMLRLVYDSLAAKYAQVFRNLCKLAGKPLTTLHIIGGGSQNGLLNQLTADECGVKVVAGPAEGTALGNIMIQAGLSRADILASIETKIFLPNE